MIPTLVSGDVFATRNPMMLGRIINFIQKIWSWDNKSQHSHAGIIRNNFGDTLESNWRVESQNIFEAYGGKEVLIARHQGMTHDKYCRGIVKVFGHYGQVYPFWRLFLHIVPPLAKYLHFSGRLVCSELVAEFLYQCGLRHKYYAGCNVDTLVDEWKNYDDYDVIFEGILPTPEEMSKHRISIGDNDESGKLSTDCI